MKLSVAIVPNSRPAYVAEPVGGELGIEEICLEPVTAWKVLYYDDENSDMASSIPITIHAVLPGQYAVYYSDTDMWAIPELTSDKGLDSLLVYFQEQERKTG
jgi:hypothetical protein